MQRHHSDALEELWDTLKHQILSQSRVSATPSRGRGRSVAIAAAVIIVVAIVAGYYLLSGTASPPPATTKSSAASVQIPSGTGTNQALNFSPQAITVVIGVNNTITWLNDDSTFHTITFTSAPSGVSPSSLTDPSNLLAGGSYSVTLTTPGTYQYHCTIHSWMRGTITVVQAAASPY